MGYRRLRGNKKWLASYWRSSRRHPRGLPDLARAKALYVYEPDCVKLPKALEGATVSRGWRTEIVNAKFFASLVAIKNILRQQTIRQVL
jgi:hypothetical protein